MNHHDNTGWAAIATAWAFWIAGHITLSNIAFIVSICVGLLQGWKTWRDIRKDKQ